MRKFVLSAGAAACALGVIAADLGEANAQTRVTSATKRNIVLPPGMTLYTMTNPHGITVTTTNPGGVGPITYNTGSRSGTWTPSGTWTMFVTR